jgi:hypothetical protein
MPTNNLNNVPVTGQSLASSRDPINANFSTIGTTFSVNHIPYLDGSGNGGWHQFVQFPSGVPVGVTNNGTNQVALYANVGPQSGVPELFFQRNNLGANTGYSITEFLGATDGWTRLPSGIILKWGFMNIGGTGSAPLFIPFPTSPANTPAYQTACYNVQVTGAYNSSTTGNNVTPAQVSYSTAPTTLGFTLTWSGGSWNSSTAIYYFAIGI